MTHNKYETYTEAQIIKECWDIQNACNLYAVASVLPLILKRLQRIQADNNIQEGDFARNHIAVQWLADKIADLAGRNLQAKTERQKKLFEQACYGVTE